MKRLNPYYVTGLVEGEGSFYVGILPKRLKEVKFEVRPSFSLSQERKNRKILFLLKKFFGCGFIRPNRKEKTLKYEVRSFDELKEKIVPHFEKYPLKGRKRRDFEKFKNVIEMMDKNLHLKKEGLREIVKIVMEMTESEKRKKFLLKIATSLKE